MAEEEVGLRLSLKNRREVASGVHQVGTELDRVGHQAASVNRQSRIASRGIAAFGRAGRTAGKVAALGIGAASAAVVAAGYAATKVVKASLSEAREAQKVGAATRQIIKTTGGAANITARQVGKLSGAISKKAGIDDEAIQSGANLLLTFKNIRDEAGKGNDVYRQSVQAMTDMSSLPGMGGMEGAAKMLGKALNDPVKGITALSRAGVTFNATQIDTIKGLVTSGDLLGAQKIILGELGSEFGGLAEKQATWGDKAKVSLGNIEESLGTALLPLFDRVERWFVNKGAPALENYVGIFEKRGIPKIREYANLFFDRGIPAMKRFYDQAKPVAESVLPAIGTAFGTIKDAVGFLAPKMKAMFDGFNKLPDWAKSAIAIGAGGAVVGKKLGVFSGLSKMLGGSNSGGLIGAFTKTKPLPVIVVNDLPGFKKEDAAASLFKKSPWALSLGLLAIPTIGGAAAAWATDPADRNQMAPGSAGYAGDGGMTLPGHALNFGESDKNYQNYLKATGQLSEVARARIDEIAAAFKTLPPKLQTDIVLHGAPESKREAKALAREYDLAGADRKTLFYTSGIPVAQNQTTHLLQKYGLVAKPVTTKVSAVGVSTATQQVSTLLAQLHALTDHGWNFTALGSVPSSAPHRERGGPVTAGQGYVVGERRPEYFVPKVDGTILPKVPDMPSFDNEDWGGHVGSGEPIVVQVVLERKVLAEATFDVAREKLART